MDGRTDDRGTSCPSQMVQPLAPGINLHVGEWSTSLPWPVPDLRSGPLTWGHVRWPEQVAPVADEGSDLGLIPVHLSYRSGQASSQVDTMGPVAHLL